MIRTRARHPGRLALLALCGLAACSSNNAQQPDRGGPGAEAGPSVDQGGSRADGRPPADPAAMTAPRFSFHAGQDALSRALSAAHLAFVTAPATKEQAEALAQQRKEAAAALARDPEGAAAKIIAELAAVEQADPADEEGLLDLLHLLGEVESAQGFAFLHDFALREPPELPPDQPEAHRNARAALLLLRPLAVQQLGRRAVRGSQAAKVKLLELVGAARGDVLAVAIRNYYRASKLRFKAKRELMAKLKPADRYLAHQVY